MVKKVLLLILVNCILLYSGILLAQKSVWAISGATESASVQISNLPTVHILPDNPLYFLKTLKERVQLLITRDASSQADLLLTFSQKRLAEAQKVAAKGKVHISEKLLEAFGKDIEVAQEKIKQARERGEQTRKLFLKLQGIVAYQKELTEKLQLDSFLVEVDEELSEPVARSYIPSATESGKMSGGREIFDWLKGLFGKKEVLSPIVQ